jgi:hypothetical protein
MDKTGWFCETGSEAHTLEKAFIKAYNGNIFPATKEQRELLFSKMKEAGYEWDTNHKQLKKIEQKPAWSEEDETKIKSIIAFLKSPALCAMDGNKGIIDENIKYLKSLKERVLPQPEQEWSEEDNKISRLIGNAIIVEDASIYLESEGIQVIDAHIWLEELKERVQQPKKGWSENDEKTIVKMRDFFIGVLGDKPDFTEDKRYEEFIEFIDNRLKSLRPQSQWMPSDEQMGALWSATEKYLESDDENVRTLRGEVLGSLYNDLKKLETKGGISYDRIRSTDSCSSKVSR